MPLVYKVRFEYIGMMPVSIGPHAVSIDRDCLIVRQHGTFTLEHQIVFCELGDKVIAEHGHMFIINDSSAGGDFSAEARRYATKWHNVVHVWGAVHVGASFMFSVVVGMMTRTIALFSKHQFPIVTTKTEAEAYVWVAEQRQKRLHAQPNKH